MATVFLFFYSVSRSLFTRLSFSRGDGLNEKILFNIPLFCYWSVAALFLLLLVVVKCQGRIEHAHFLENFPFSDSLLIFSRGCGVCEPPPPPAPIPRRTSFTVAQFPAPLPLASRVCRDLNYSGNGTRKGVLSQTSLVPSLFRFFGRRAIIIRRCGFRMLLIRARTRSLASAPFFVRRRHRSSSFCPPTVLLPHNQRIAKKRTRRELKDQY